MKRQAVTVEISGRELGAAIGCSLSACVTGAFWDSLRHSLLIRVECPGLPDVPEGHVPIEISPRELIERIVEIESYGVVVSDSELEVEVLPVNTVKWQGEVWPVDDDNS